MAKNVSVIIPTYNYGKFIKEAITSVFRQTCPISEIIIVDDGSTDDTASIVEAFGERVTYIKQNNAGVCEARNLGVAESKSAFIAFLDADDIWEPTKIEKQLAKFKEDPEIGLVHCGIQEFDSKSGRTIAKSIEGEEGWVAKEHVLFERPVINVSGSVIMVSRRAFDEVGGFDTNLTNGEDWEFCFRVAQKYKVGFVREPLVNYRNHGVNAHLNVVQMERSTLIAWKKIFSNKEDSIQCVKRRSYGNLHKILAGSYLHNRQYGGFVRNLGKSLWYRPSLLRYYLSLLSPSRQK